MKLVNGIEPERNFTVHQSGTAGVTAWCCTVHVAQERELESNCLILHISANGAQFQSTLNKQQFFVSSKMFASFERAVLSGL